MMISPVRWPCIAHMSNSLRRLFQRVAARGVEGGGDVRCCDIAKPLAVFFVAVFPAGYEFAGAVGVCHGVIFVAIS